MKKELLKVDEFHASMNDTDDNGSIITELRRLLDRDTFEADYGVSAKNPTPLGGTWLGWP